MPAPLLPRPIVLAPPASALRLPCPLIAQPQGPKILGLQQTSIIMTRNKSKVETLIIALLLIIGLAGAFFLFSGSSDQLAAPGHSLENPGSVYQEVSMN